MQRNVMTKCLVRVNVYFVLMLYFLLEVRCAVTYQLRGAGASFPAEVYKNLRPAYVADRQQHRVLNMTYQSIGSGSGQRQIQQNDDIEYAGSDYILSASDKLSYPDLISIPVLAGAVVVAYNIPNLNGRLQLTQEQIVGIYNGSYRFWNDSVFTESNPTLTFPNVSINVIARGDKSGTTQIFTKALSAFDENWNTVYGEFSKGYDYTNERPFHWKDGVILYFGQQNRGTSGLILSFKYSIGYMSLADALESDLDYALMQNAAGSFTNADSNAVQEAMDWQLQYTNDVAFDLVNSIAPSAYPITGFTYFIVYKTSMKDCVSAKELVRYIRWIYSESVENICNILGFATVSDKLAERVVTKILKSMTCAGQNVWNGMLSDIEEEGRIKEENQWLIPLSVGIPLFGIIMLTMVTYIIVQKVKLYRRLESDEWNIDIEDIMFFYDPKVNSDRSSQAMAMSMSCRSMKHVDDINNGVDVVSQILQWPGKWKGHTVGFSFIKIEDFKAISRETKKCMLRMRDSIIQTNVQRFFGLSELEFDRYIIGEYCSKGSLQKMLHDGKYNLTNDFKISIATDITSGMNFLHGQNIVHGFFNSNCCLIDFRWTVKIGGWEYFKLFKVQEPYKNPYVRLQKMHKDDKSVFDHFWVAPEILKAEFREEGTAASDVYSYAIVLQEIFTRQMPYTEHLDFTSVEDILKAIVSNHLRPHVGTDIPVCMRQVMEIAWCENPISRPSFEQISKIIKHSTKSNKSVLDSMIDAMDEYTQHLEERIFEQSSEISIVRRKLSQAYREFIPKQHLKNLTDSGRISPKEYPFLAIVALRLAEANQILETFSAKSICNVFQQYYKKLKQLCSLHGGFRIEGNYLEDIIVFGFDSGSELNTIMQMGNFCIDIHDCLRNTPSTSPSSAALRFGIKVGGHVGECKTGVVGAYTKKLLVAGQTVDMARRLVNICVNHETLVSKEAEERLIYSEAFILNKSSLSKEGEESFFRLLGRTGLNMMHQAIPEEEDEEDEEDDIFPCISVLQELDKPDYSMFNSFRPSIERKSLKMDIFQNGKSSVPRNKSPKFRKHSNGSNKVRPM